MRKLTYILIIFFGLITGCNSTGNKTNLTPRLSHKHDILDRLKYQKQFIDALFNQNKDKLIFLAKLTDNDNLVLFMDGNFPENFEITFSILKDSLGQILTVSEFPFSESGDWYIVKTHYFDNEGKTFAFERQTNFFNSFCTEGVAFETKTEFYNNHFQLVDKTYRLVDEKNRTLQKDSCQFPYDHEYKISPDIDKYLQTSGIKYSL